MEVVEKTLQPEGAQEGYTISINLEDKHVTVNIIATTYFGARSVVYKSKNVYLMHLFRHAFETLFQLAAWDAASSSFNIAASVEVVLLNN